MKLKAKSSRLKAKKLEAQGSKFLLPSCFQLSALLLSAFTFLLLALFFCQAWADAPRMNPRVQGIVYAAQQAIADKDYDKAVQILQNFLKKHPKRDHYLVEFTLANALALSEKEQEGLAHYQAAVRLYPECSPAWQNMGKLYFDLKQYDKAGDCLSKAYSLAEIKDVSNLYYAAISYVLAERHNKALPHLKYLVSGKAGPPKIEWLEAFFQVCMKLHLKDEAFKVIQYLINEDEDNPRWWKFLAYLYLQQNDYKNAVVALTIRSYIIPLKKDDLVLLGDLNYAIGLPLKATGYYEQAIALEDDIKPAEYEKLASVYIAGHKPAKAKDVLNRALKKKPTSRLWFMLGQVLYEEEEFDEAYQAFEQSASLHDKDGRPWLMMAYCALQMDKYNNARSALQKAARFPKQQKKAKELLKQLNLASNIRNKDSRR
ncbi:MAG: tetratricopeptide repeat protein [Deltaproteobacteria bacterium]|nr:tetratricopeptide repeat protein [Deltaproteobacteria bacterium]